MFNCPLFLNSVWLIQLEEIEALTGKLIKSYEVVATQSPQDQKKYNTCVWCLRKPSADVSEGSLKIRDIAVT
jgi:hypothetical protein